MNYEVRMTRTADNDLRGIFEYIAFDLQSVQNAVAQLDRLEKGIASLDQMPERFRVYERDPWYSRNLHIMPVDNFLIFYISDRERRIVTILRVMYGGRDVDRQLRESIEDE